MLMTKNFDTNIWLRFCLCVGIHMRISRLIQYAGVFGQRSCCEILFKGYRLKTYSSFAVHICSGFMQESMHKVADKFTIERFPITLFWCRMLHFFFSRVARVLFDCCSGDLQALHSNAASFSAMVFLRVLNLL